MARSDAPTGLRRGLSVWQAVGLSVALMAPSMAANINPQGSATYAGRAVPLTFLLAGLGVLLVAYGFVRLCQHFESSGSVYAFNGAVFGPRTGVVSGLGLLGTYAAFGVVTSTAAGIFGTAFLQDVRIWPDPPTEAPYALAGVALVGALLLTVTPARRGTSVLLAVEGATVALILLVSTVVLVRVVGGGTPSGLTVDVFTVPAGTSTDGLFLGIVFGFLSFAGFEAAATLGEEARAPRRDIPRALVWTAVFGTVFFTLVTALAMTAYGTDPAGVAAFAGSTSLIGDLGTTYVADWVGELVTLGAAISAFGCCLACVVGASRMLYAMGRDAAAASRLARTSHHGTPTTAAVVVVTAIALVVLVAAVVLRADPFTTFLDAGTVGTLVLLVVYLVTTAGAFRLVFVQRRMEVPRWQAVLPVLATVVLGYTLYRNVVPLPTDAGGWVRVLLAVGWLVGALVLVLAARGSAERVGHALTAAEGLAPADVRRRRA